MTTQTMKNLNITTEDIARALKEALTVYKKLENMEAIEGYEEFKNKLENEIIVLNEILKARGIDILQ